MGYHAHSLDPQMQMGTGLHSMDLQGHGQGLGGLGLDGTAAGGAGGRGGDMLLAPGAGHRSSLEHAQAGGIGGYQQQ